MESAHDGPGWLERTGVAGLGKIATIPSLTTTSYGHNVRLRQWLSLKARIQESGKTKISETSLLLGEQLSKSVTTRLLMSFVS